MTRLTNRNIGQYAWATPINGGFSIVSIHHPPYQKVNIPERCEYSDLEVINCPESFNLFQQVTKLAEEQVGLIMANVRNALSPLARGIESNQNSRATDPTNTNHKIEELVWLLVGCSVPANIMEEVTPLATAGERWTRVFNERIGTLACEVAENAGHSIKDKAPEGQGTVLGFLLNLAGTNGEFRSKSGVRTRVQEGAGAAG